MQSVAIMVICLQYYLLCRSAGIIADREKGETTMNNVILVTGDSGGLGAIVEEILESDATWLIG